MYTDCNFGAVSDRQLTPRGGLADYMRRYCLPIVKLQQRGVKNANESFARRHKTGSPDGLIEKPIARRGH